MSKSLKNIPLMAFALMASVAGALLFAAPASAQKAPMLRVRGAIESVDGPVLTVKSRDGNEVKVHLADNVAVIGLAKSSLSDIKQGSYIGVTAMPQADGSQKAIAIHIFAEAQRGTNEGFMKWDLRPNSTMTNATVAQTVAGVDGQNITVKYKDGEKKVVVSPDTPIVAFVSADKSELKPGAQIIIFGATKNEDGTLEASRIGVGLNGITPPM
jgi:hypothetical protein